MATKKAAPKTSPSGALYRHSTRSVIVEMPLAVAKDIHPLLAYIGAPVQLPMPSPTYSATMEESCAKVGRLLNAAIKHAVGKGAR